MENMEEMIISDLKENKVSKNIVKDIKAWKFFIRNRLAHGSMENRR